MFVQTKRNGGKCLYTHSVRQTPNHVKIAILIISHYELTNFQATYLCIVVYPDDNALTGLGTHS